MYGLLIYSSHTSPFMADNHCLSFHDLMQENLNNYSSQTGLTRGDVYMAVTERGRVMEQNQA